MRIDSATRIWCVTDPTLHSTLPDICFATTLDGLRLQFAGGLSMDDRPVVFTTEEEARDEARSRARREMSRPWHLSTIRSAIDHPLHEDWMRAALIRCRASADYLG